MSFFRRAFRQAGFPFDFTILDTLALVRNQYPHNKSHKLGTMCKQLGISLLNAHRAVHDARATSLLLLKVVQEIQQEKHIPYMYMETDYSSTDAGQVNTRVGAFIEML